MYRLVPVKYGLGTLLLGPLTFLAGAVLLALAIWLSATSPKNEEGAQFIFAVLCYVLALGSLATSFVGFCFLYDAYRNGMQIIFEEQRLIIHYPWPGGTRTYSWADDILYVDVKYETIGHSQNIAWAPIPLAALFPGSAALLNVTVREQQFQNVRTFQVLHKDGHVITEIPSTTPTSFKLSRWFSRKTLFEAMRVFKGQITWKGDEPRVVAIRGFQFEEGMFELVIEWLHLLPGLEELDLTGTNVTDDDLMLLERGFPKLKKVHTMGTPVSEDFRDRLDESLRLHNLKPNQFDFS